MPRPIEPPIRETWGPQCNGFLAFSTQTDPRIPAMRRSSFNSFQSTRLPYQFSSQEDHFLGRRLRRPTWAKEYFNSGGAGYVLSQSALRKLTTIGLDHPECSAHKRTSMEDVMVAESLQKLFNITIQDTRDEQERERFHLFSPAWHLNYRYPGSNKKLDWHGRANAEWGVKFGTDCCAPDSASFYYIKNPAMVRHLHSLLYDCNTPDKHDATGGTAVSMA